MSSLTINVIQNLIEGAWCISTSDRVFSHASPRIESSPIDVSHSEILDVVQAVGAMNRAQAIWNKETIEDRTARLKQLLIGFSSALENSRQLLAESLAIDIGMPLTYALSRSVPAARATVEATIGLLAEGTNFPVTGNSAVLLGWTDPLLGFCRRVPQIVASGNGVCVKPSSRAPRTVSLVAELFLQSMRLAGIPNGFLSVLNGFGAGEDEVGEILVRHPGIKTIYWIGNTENAMVARRTAFEHGKRFHFVGCGRNPLLLFSGFKEDRQTKLIDQIARSIIDPHGFGPFRPSRLFVQESIFKSTLEQLAEKFSLFKSGDPLLKQTEVGPLPVAEAERFDIQTRLALAETGHCVVGGARNGLFAEPTLIRDLTNCSTLQSQELAGPWATIASFKYPHEALKYANTSPLGLAGYILHPDPEKSAALRLKLEASRIFFSGAPPWPEAFIRSAQPVKSSANLPDGVREIYEMGQWTSTVILDNSESST